MESDPTDDPLIALLRSAASNVDAAARLYAAMQAYTRRMQANSVELYRNLLLGPDPAARVELLGALLIGATFSRYIMRSCHLVEMNPDEVRGCLIPVLRTILLG